MKFRDLLIESFYKGVEVAGGHYVEIFKNPSTKEVEQIIKNSSFKSIRISYDLKKNDMYVWDGDIAHLLILNKHIPKTFANWYYEPNIINHRFLTDWKFNKSQIEKIKNSKSFKTIINTSFKNVKKISVDPFSINKDILINMT